MMKTFITLMIFAIAYLFTSGCTTEVKKRKSSEVKTIRGYLLEQDTKKPLKSTKITFFRQKKPLLAMRNWVEIGSVETDINGFFEYQTHYIGDFKLEWNPGNNAHSEYWVIADFNGTKELNLIHRNAFGREAIWDRK